MLKKESSFFIEFFHFKQGTGEIWKFEFLNSLKQVQVIAFAHLNFRKILKNAILFQAASPQSGIKVMFEIG